MNGDQGFIDLRLNRQEGQNNESFWPSFTDIMTVIVMIFLIAMVILLIRNMELVKQLRVTVEAERTAMELARSTGEEKQSLAMRLNVAENAVSRLQLKNLRLEEEIRALEKQSGEQGKRLSFLDALRDALESEKAKLTKDLEKQSAKLSSTNKQLEESTKQLKESTARGKQLASELETVKTALKSSEQKLSDLQARSQSMETELADARSSLAGSDEKFSKLRNRNAELTQQLAALQQKVDSQKQELEKGKLQFRVTDIRLAELQGEFDELQFKYDKLVKPARTSSGKYVVEIRHFKRGGSSHIEYREPGQSSFQSVSRSALESRLAELRKNDPDKLYIKIIFPENSGLSYEQALKFTTELHKRYDYYFR